MHCKNANSFNLVQDMNSGNSMELYSEKNDFNGNNVVDKSHP
jgi:hypothetical protein